MNTLPIQAGKPFSKHPYLPIVTWKGRILNKEVQQHVQACNGGSHD